jgi:hypothetical protein
MKLKYEKEFNRLKDVANNLSGTDYREQTLKDIAEIRQGIEFPDISVFHDDELIIELFRRLKERHSKY